MGGENRMMHSDLNADPDHALLREVMDVSR